MTTTIAEPQARFLNYKRIGFEAQRLLVEYASEHAPIEAPPIPVEEMLERHLGLALSICNLGEVLGCADALGALDVCSREVLVDQSLDPSDFPDLEGRYRFTLAHEIGHWWLHRHLYRQSEVEVPSFVMRAGGSKQRIERQADYFAACLLMPRPLVYQRWKETLGGRVVTLSQLEPDREAILEREIIRRGIAPESPAAAENMLFDWAVIPLATEFCVSPMAMRIRLEELRLVVR